METMGRDVETRTPEQILTDAAWHIFRSDWPVIIQVEASGTLILVMKIVTQQPLTTTEKLLFKLLRERNKMMRVHFDL